LWSSGSEGRLSISDGVRPATVENFFMPLGVFEVVSADCKRW